MFIALAVFAAGCGPPGPRALLRGKKLLDRGNVASAVAEFKIATSLLATNAQAWNYLGVAEQRAGRPADAALAYQRALTLDRDLVEAHYNLGCLWLEQNKPAAAKNEFTAYTLRRPNDPAGWTQLGLAELRRRDLAAAEKEFSTALLLRRNDAEALNGLGLARLQRGLPQEAAQYFAAAVRAHPDYAPALLNLAVVEDEYLRHRALAWREYRAYLEMRPRPAEWEAVRALLAGRQKQRPARNAIAATKPPPVAKHEVAKPKPQTEIAAAPQPVPPRRTTEAETPEKPQAPPAAPPPRAPPVAKAEAAKPRPQAQAAPAPQPVVPRRTAEAAAPAKTEAPRAEPAPQVVRVQPEPVLNATTQTQGTAEHPVIEPPPPRTAPRNRGFISRLNPARWFGSSTPEESQASQAQSGVTPLPSSAASNAAAGSARQPPPRAAVARTAPAPRPVPTFPRYTYLRPPKPEPGNRRAAMRDFDLARELEQSQQTELAMQSYQNAAQQDPGWFRAQYNFAVLAYRLHHDRLALKADEMALAIRPQSVDARYTFALALAASGYAIDARDELERILAAHPDEARAHLALGNLYAQQFDDPTRARAHYLKVLALDPGNPEATAIRFWLSAHQPAP